MESLLDFIKNETKVTTSSISLDRLTQMNVIGAKAVNKRLLSRLIKNQELFLRHSYTCRVQRIVCYTDHFEKYIRLWSTIV